MQRLGYSPSTPPPIIFEHAANRSTGSFSYSRWGQVGPQMLVDVPSYRSRYYLLDSPYFSQLEKYGDAADELDIRSMNWLKSKRRLNTLESVGNTMNSAGRPPLDRSLILAQIRDVIEREKDMIRAYAVKIAIEHELIEDSMAWCDRPTDDLLAETLNLEERPLLSYHAGRALRAATRTNDFNPVLPVVNKPVRKHTPKVRASEGRLLVKGAVSV
ncbi:hypothetical protein DXG01_016789 [Tephrocybe rancida]|nr:hypothetical protein DXG01_016789 [Tephrocybe rancida]